MNGWKDVWMYGRMNGRNDEWKDGWTGRMNVWMEGWTDWKDG